MARGAPSGRCRARYGARAARLQLPRHDSALRGSGRRQPVRRRAGDGAPRGRRRRGVRGGLRRRSGQSRRGPHAGRAPARPVPRRGARHGAGADAALRPVRGLRPADPRPPLLRHGLDRPVRPLRRRDPSARGRRRCRKKTAGRAHGRIREVESFSAALDGGLEYPHYTRPAEFRGWRVPEVLLSGDHARIEDWRRERVRSVT